MTHIKLYLTLTYTVQFTIKLTYIIEITNNTNLGDYLEMLFWSIYRDYNGPKWVFTPPFCILDTRFSMLHTILPPV